MNKKIFAVSDIHGDFTSLQNALNNAGFDEDNPDHLLISLGDAFDRGRECLNVYKYLKYLSDNGQAIVLKGNHTNFVIEYLSGNGINPFNYLRNGTDETFAGFLGYPKPFEFWCINKEKTEPTVGDFNNWLKDAVTKINGEYPELLEWLKSRPYYFETNNYIFTHASIDVTAEDWHKPHFMKYHYVDWDALMWDDGTFFGRRINNTDKKIVIGHFSTEELRKMYNIPYKLEEKNSILIREDGRVIAIDGCTAVTHRVNVFIIDDELLIKEGEMK